MTLCENNSWFYFSWISIVTAINFWFFHWCQTHILSFYESNNNGVPKYCPPMKTIGLILTFVSVTSGVSGALIQLKGGWSFNQTLLTFLMIYLCFNGFWILLQFRVKCIKICIILCVLLGISSFVLFMMMWSEGYVLSALFFIPQIIWAIISLRISANEISEYSNSQINSDISLDENDTRFKI